MDVKMKKCENCEVEVETSKFFMHENYCKKNYTHCKNCNEVVEIITQEDHNRQKHQDFPCSLCNKMLKKFAIPEHMKVCPKRLRQCPYCELDLEDSELTSHLKVCGSHTDCCAHCLNTFLVKEMKGHLKLCKKNPENQKNPSHNNNFNDYGINSNSKSEISNPSINNYQNNYNSKGSLEGYDFETMDLIRKLQDEEDIRLVQELMNGNTEINKSNEEKKKIERFEPKNQVSITKQQLADEEYARKIQEELDQNLAFEYANYNSNLSK